jgi:Ca-activated chloride channel family protein
MYELDNIEYFYLLFIPLLMLLWIMLNSFLNKRRLKQFSDDRLLERLSPSRSDFKRKLKNTTLLLAFVFMVIALVNPKVGSKLVTVKRQGVDIVFALDVSKSMLAEDVAPNRLLRAKQIISKVIDNLGGDRIGIIAYAGKSYPLLPITTDYSAAKMMLQNVNTDMIPSQGTAISSAIAMTSQYFDDEDQKNRVLVIISDGEDHGEDAENISREIAQRGVSIYTIGVGSEKGGPIPIKSNGNVIGYKKDSDDNVVVTKLNSKVLQQIASSANGKYLDSQDSKSLTEEFTKILQGMDKKEFESKVFSDYEHQFQWFIGLALLFLILDSLFLERKTKWIQKLNLFNEKNDYDE